MFGFQSSYNIIRLWNICFGFCCFLDNWKVTFHSSSSHLWSTLQTNIVSNFFLAKHNNFNAFSMWTQLCFQPFILHFLYCIASSSVSQQLHLIIQNHIYSENCIYCSIIMFFFSFCYRSALRKLIFWSIYQTIKESILVLILGKRCFLSLGQRSCVALLCAHSSELALVARQCHRNIVVAG